MPPQKPQKLQKSRKSPSWILAYLEKLGVAARMQNKETVHLNEFQNLKFLVRAIGRQNIRGTRQPKGEPLTIKVIQAPTDISLRQFKMQCEQAARLHKKTRALCVSTECLAAGQLCATEIVPDLFFWGLDERERAFVLVMDRVKGNAPTARTDLPGIVAVEKALFTLYILGVTMEASMSRDLLIDQSTLAVSIIDFRRARAVSYPWRSQSALKTLSPNLDTWEAPQWFHALVSSTVNKQQLTNARRKTWKLLSNNCASMNQAMNQPMNNQMNRMNGMNQPMNQPIEE